MVISGRLYLGVELVKSYLTISIFGFNSKIYIFYLFQCHVNSCITKIRCALTKINIGYFTGKYQTRVEPEIYVIPS